MTADLPVTEVITASDVATRVAELGVAISEDFEGRRPILVGMLVGALPFLADLIRQISIPVDVDFLALSRFGEGGRLRVVLDTAENLVGRHVIIVDDVIDTGLSLTVLRRMMADRGAASVSTVALLDNEHRLYADNRRTQLDLRVAKVFRFGGKRLDLGVDGENLLNTNYATGYAGTYQFSTGNTALGGTWNNPTTIYTPRFARVNITVSF